MPTENNINIAAEKAVNFSFGSSYGELYDDILKIENTEINGQRLKSPKKSKEASTSVEKVGARAWLTTPL